MSIVSPPQMTIEEFYALSDDGMDRELIRGVLVEKPMTTRNPRHSITTSRIDKILGIWLAAQAEPRGEVLAGEAGFVLRRNPDSTVGIDVAYISAELAAATPERARYVEGVPTLAVEILSPSDKQEEILEKVELYLEVGVPLVWVVEPYFQTITVYRPGAKPQMFNTEDELVGEPKLPGFRMRLADLFQR